LREKERERERKKKKINDRFYISKKKQHSFEVEDAGFFVSFKCYTKTINGKLA